MREGAGGPPKASSFAKQKTGGDSRSPEDTDPSAIARVSTPWDDQQTRGSDGNPRQDPSECHSSPGRRASPPRGHARRAYDWVKVPSTNWVFTQNPDGTIVFQFPHLIEAGFLKVKTIWDDRNLDNESIDEASVGNVATELVKVWALKKTQFAQYEYDNQGNRIKLTVDGEVHGYSYYRNGAGGNLSWLAADGTWYYRYDENGNLVTKAKQATIDPSSRDFTVDTSQEYWTYAWDLHNRLASVFKNGTLLVSYAYDVDNLRVSRTKGTETTVYAYGRTGAITYQKNLATRVARTYRYLGGETVGWTDTAADGTTTPMFSATDHQGSVTQVTNASATVVWSSEYQPFGKTAGVEGLYDFDGSYAGHQVDIDTGLIYMWNRWQDPETGRFISEDPARDGNNWYGYAGNNPETFTDPTGLEPHNGAADGYDKKPKKEEPKSNNNGGGKSKPDPKPKTVVPPKVPDVLKGKPQNGETDPMKEIAKKTTLDKIKDTKIEDALGGTDVPTKVLVGYRDVIPGIAYHALIITEDASGRRQTIVEGMPENQAGGVLGSASLSPGSSSGASSGGSASGSSGYGYGKLVEQIVTRDPSSLPADRVDQVPIPSGTSVGQFVKRIENARDSYAGGTNYSATPGGNEGNSNSLVGSVLRQSGSSFTPKKLVPGWPQNVLNR